MASCDRLPAARDGLLVVGHGTREELGIGEFLRVVDDLARRFPHVPIEPCFLELAQPSIADAIGKLSSAACGS